MTRETKTLFELRDRLRFVAEGGNGLELEPEEAAVLIRAIDGLEEIAEYVNMPGRPVLALMAEKALGGPFWEPRPIEPDPLAGLPPELARVLRDQSIIVQQDAAVFDLIASWAKARSDTLSADEGNRG